MKQKNCHSLWIILILAAILLTSCGKYIGSVKLNGYSMRPNFDDGQIFKIEKVAPDKLQRGDLVLFEMFGRQYIKRLVGLPNEWISIHDGGVFINDVRLDEPYKVVAPTYILDGIKLDNDTYFVLGDDREYSVDSHVWGALLGDNIKGKAVLP